MYVPKRGARKEEKKMEIIDNRKEPCMKKFRDIPIGECFIDDDGDITIKATDADIEDVFAICLRTGKQWFPCDGHEFEVVSASVVIE